MSCSWNFYSVPGGNCRACGGSGALVLRPDGEGSDCEVGMGKLLSPATCNRHFLKTQGRTA